MSQGWREVICAEVITPDRRARRFSSVRRPRRAGYNPRMCELLGMECNVPTDITFSFAGLSARGGRRGPHAHGWGLALYEGNVAHVFREPAPACESPLARFVREHPIKTLLAIAHVRRKTRGK